MVYFSLAEREAGTLTGALGALSSHGVNLLTIRSYANAQSPGMVDFIATTDGHEGDPQLAAAIETLKGKVAVVRVLGSFAVPRAGP